MTRNRKRRHLTIGLAAAVLFSLGLASQAVASNAIAKKEGDLACTRCHDKPGSKLLTDFGKYYELMGSTEGFRELETRFAKCTDCHVKKPGSTRLTKVGERYKWMMGDMDGIRAWLMERHPSGEEEEHEGGDGSPGSTPPVPVPRWLLEVN